MLQSISARQIQREYKKIFQQVNKTNEPLVVVTNNKPVGAIISLELLDQLEKQKLDMVVQEAVAEYKSGKTKSIKTRKELNAWFDEIKKAASE